MHQRRLGGLGVLALALASCSLPAQDISYGGQVTGSWPGGDIGGHKWLHHHVGGGAGVHVLLAMEDGYALVPRFDYVSYEKKPAKVQMFQLGTDLDYFFSARANVGPYLGGGILFTQARFQLNGDAGSAQATSKAPGAAFIAGWMFTQHLGAEWRLGWTKFKPNLEGTVSSGYPARGVVGAQTMNASFIFHF